ncbi:YeiH family protein [Oryzibacter oryziterrae]|uniref:YeiH family protein n=1 Tax=Oryzibacter oryziterrae TaxID=2766474 RepID=UPI001F00CC77|nr:putative sulfate exporter family transporter [Oryzibacter oryziterrae]
MSETHDDLQSAALEAPLQGLQQMMPGLLLCCALTGGAYALRLVPGLNTFSPMILAIIGGMIVNNTIGVGPALRPGIVFSMRRLLRAAIVLLGLQLTLTQVSEVGLGALAIIASAVAATFLATVQMGRWLGVDGRLAQLIAAGTSICGASAVAAADSVVEADDEDVAYAVACVTVFGSISMFAYPWIGHLLSMDPRSFGLWAGSSIHEVAQVVAAAFAYGPDGGTTGTIAKLTRVMMLAPVVFAMAGLAARKGVGRHAGVRPPLPIFVFGFLGMVLLNSAIPLPPAIKADLALLSTVLLTMALAAMGLETNFGKLTQRGLRPALLGALASLFIATWTLGLIKLL